MGPIRRHLPGWSGFWSHRHNYDGLSHLNRSHIRCLMPFRRPKLPNAAISHRQHASDIPQIGSVEAGPENSAVAQAQLLHNVLLHERRGCGSQGDQWNARVPLHSQQRSLGRGIVRIQRRFTEQMLNSTEQTAFLLSTWIRPRAALLTFSTGCSRKQLARRQCN